MTRTRAAPSKEWSFNYLIPVLFLVTAVTPLVVGTRSVVELVEGISWTLAVAWILVTRARRRRGARRPAEVLEGSPSPPPDR